jgi:hypothetical protein
MRECEMRLKRPCSILRWPIWCLAIDITSSCIRTMLDNDDGNNIITMFSNASRVAYSDAMRRDGT